MRPNDTTRVWRKASRTETPRKARRGDYRKAGK